MATHKGSEGTVKVGSNAVAEIRSYSIEESADTLEDTSMGDSARTYKSSLTSFSGSLDVFWDETDTSGQGALTIGSEVTLNVYPEGDTSGDTYYTVVDVKAPLPCTEILASTNPSNDALLETPVTIAVPE